MNTNHPTLKNEDLTPAVPLPVLLFILVAVVGGAFAAILITPEWLPGVEASVLGGTPQVFWYLSRSSGLIAYLNLWLSMCLGLLITSKMARLWPGGPVAFDLHQHTTILGIAFALFHGLILIGDRYLDPGIKQVLFPFTMSNYHPVWVGLGQVGFYLMLVVTLSFYARKRILARKWRLIHYLSFVAFSFALLHGIFSGTDSSSVWVQVLYMSTGAVVLFLFIYRVLAAVLKPVPAGETN